VISVLANRIKNSTTDPEVLRKIANWLEERLKEPAGDMSGIIKASEQRLRFSK